MSLNTLLQQIKVDPAFRVSFQNEAPRIPSLPFELGLAVSWAKRHPRKHTWFTFESENRRAQKSISDLNGTDFNIHDGTTEGVMRELCNAFVRANQRPNVPEMVSNYRELRRLIPEVLRRAGTRSVFEARYLKICPCSRLRYEENGYNGRPRLVIAQSDLPVSVFS